MLYNVDKRSPNYTSSRKSAKCSTLLSLAGDELLDFHWTQDAGANRPQLWRWPIQNLRRAVPLRVGLMGIFLHYLSTASLLYTVGWRRADAGRQHFLLWSCNGKRARLYILILCWANEARSPLHLKSLSSLSTGKGLNPVSVQYSPSSACKLFKFVWKL